MQQIAWISGGGLYVTPHPSYGVGTGTAIGGIGTLVEHGLQLFSRSVAVVGSVLRGTSNAF
jgi:hypothetical protein